MNDAETTLSHIPCSPWLRRHEMLN